MAKFLSFLSIVFLLSCGKKECVKTAAPEMIGDWVHYSENNGFHYLYIQQNGRGHQYGRNDHGNNVDTQRRGWFIKDDVLHFRRWNDKATSDVFVINQYPVTADSSIYLPYDTIEAGQQFMILNQRYYKKMH